MILENIWFANLFGRFIILLDQLKSMHPIVHMSSSDVQVVLVLSLPQDALPYDPLYMQNTFSTCFPKKTIIYLQRKWVIFLVSLVFSVSLLLLLLFIYIYMNFFAFAFHLIQFQHYFIYIRFLYPIGNAFLRVGRTHFRNQMHIQVSKTVFTYD